VIVTYNPMRPICWPYPMQACFAGACEECKNSTHQCTLEELLTMSGQLDFTVKKDTIKRSMEVK
jgi:hypothetical protein